MMFFYGLFGILALVVLVALIAPKKYKVERSIIIHRPLPEVFEYLKYIRNQDHWSPWKKKDPNMHQESIGVDGDIGFINKWQGTKEVGSGEQELTRIIENERVESQLRFLKPWKSQSDAYIKVREVDEHHTEVFWGFTGNNQMPANIFMLFFNMDKVVGKDFEEGLERLKVVLEGQ